MITRRGPSLLIDGEIMQIAYVSLRDLAGHKFNGMDLCREMRLRGNDAKMYVLFKESNETWVRSICGPIGLVLIKAVHRLEYYTGLQNIMSPVLFFLLSHRHIRECDIVHFEMVQFNYFSLFMISYFAKRKRVFWTIHDPWPLTGHCIHPAISICDRWRIGCGKCPNLKAAFRVPFDCTRAAYFLKQKILGSLRMRLIVSSEYMRDMVSASPMFAKSLVSKIPFGIDRSVFFARSKKGSRKNFGISEDAFVLLVRAERSEFKGLDTFRSALAILNLQNITVITVNEKGLLNDFQEKYSIIDLGWVEDDNLLAEAYSASDAFIMPSHAESFGMMAIEAMACETVVVVSDNTALTETVDYGHSGVLIPTGDSMKLADEVRRLVDKKANADEYRKNGLKLVQDRYDLNKHYEDINNCYQYNDWQ